MLSDQGARLQARKRFAKRAAIAPTKKRLRKRSGCGLRCAGRGPPNKYQEGHRGKQQGATQRRGGSEAPLVALRVRFALLKSGSLAVHRFHMFSQCPPVLFFSCSHCEPEYRGGIDEASYPSGFDGLARGRYGCGAVL